ncbi:hypothetical protein [uncultured Maribacter sp.]|uniref:hypothetical protein n=1 Tax=uncultured Maribacter sp. TaxID=431308 RepID=UPI002622D1A2|nr:hypothetical protein [uncultured Maribacter sp.]
MNTIIVIITSLSAERRHDFSLWLKNRNRRGDTKNHLLFNYLLKGEVDDLDVKIYGKPAKNAFHALCKRLQDNLLDFLATKSFESETSEELEVLKLIVVSRIFLEQKEYNVGYKTLAKAEKLAGFMDHYSLLNEVYHTKIQYAHCNPSLSLEEVFRASILNMESFQKDFKLNMAYAEIKEKMLTTDSLPVLDSIVEEAFKKFDVSISASLSYKSLYQLMNITSITAKLQRNYYRVTPFIEEAYTLVNAKKTLAYKHLYYHIGILQVMAMVNFRNKNFENSMFFVEKMEEQMKSNNRAYYRRFLGDLNTLKGLNYNYTGKHDKALEVLEKDTSGSLDIQLIKMMCLFQQKRYREAYQIIKKLHHSDVWYEKKVGWIWVLKKSILEILLLIELDQLDLVLLRIKSFRIKFKKKLYQIEENRVLTFLQLALAYYEDPKQVLLDSFKQKVEASFNWKANEKEDIYVMSFYAWLKSKMENKGLYETTLQLVSKN